MEWNPILYDNKHDFVAEYGKGLLELVPQNAKQTILDLGCGLSEIKSNCAHIVVFGLFIFDEKMMLYHFS